MFFKNTALVSATAFIALSRAFPIALPNPFAKPVEVASLDPLKRDPTCDATCQTQGLVFSTPIDRFINDYRNPRYNSPPLIYDSDGCSVPQEAADAFSVDKDTPRGYNFLPACYRHDFGYRNFKEQGVFTEDLREQVDEQFKEDMYGHCAGYSGWESWRGVECRAYADVYFTAVRICGGGDCTIDKFKEIFAELF